MLLRPDFIEIQTDQMKVMVIPAKAGIYKWLNGDSHFRGNDY